MMQVHSLHSVSLTRQAKAPNGKSTLFTWPVGSLDQCSLTTGTEGFG